VLSLPLVGLDNSRVLPFLECSGMVVEQSDGNCRLM
jgi:hypothetical protein